MKQETINRESKLESGYKWGFETDIKSVKIPKGLNEKTIRLISKLKEEPKWMLDYRLKAYRSWVKKKHPKWAKLDLPKIDFQDIVYYSAPGGQNKPKSIDELDPELIETYKKLGISLGEMGAIEGVAVDAVFDSVSIATTARTELEKHGVIFCSISEAIKEYPDLVKKYMGKVVPINDNFYSALNSAVFSDGTFVYIPKDVRCPLELSTYFRINEADTGQFERTLIVADEGSYVSYLEGCTAPIRKGNQLHAAIVEIHALKGAEVKYSTVQNWYPGDEKTGEGGIYKFVTKRGICHDNAKISWNQVETG